MTNMPLNFERLDAVRKVIFEDIRTLIAVLDHIDSTMPPPELRVVITNSTLVALVSVIEEGLRNLFSEYLAILQETIPNYMRLKPDVRKANVKAAVQALKANVDKPRVARDIAYDLSECLSGKPGFRLLREQMVRNDGNFRTRQVTSIAQNVGIREFWKLVCECTDLEEHTGETDSARRITIVEQTWNELYDERDIIVHNYSRASGWDRGKIERTIDLCQKVLIRIPVCLDSDLKKLFLRSDLRSEVSSD